MTPTFATFARGNADFLREINVPVAKSVEAALDGSEFHHNGKKMDEESELCIDQSIKASATAAGLVVGVLCFLGTWTAKKVLDEIWALKIQPGLRERIKSLGAKQKPQESSKVRKGVFFFGIWLEELRILVLARIEGQDYVEVAELTGQVQGVLENGANFAGESQAQAGVHLYRVDSEFISEVPEIHESLNDALRLTNERKLN